MQEIGLLRGPRGALMSTGMAGSSFITLGRRPSPCSAPPWQEGKDQASPFSGNADP